MHEPGSTGIVDEQEPVEAVGRNPEFLCNDTFALRRPESGFFMERHLRLTMAECEGDRKNTTIKNI